MGRDNVGKILPFSGNIANKSRRPTVPQLNIKGPNTSKMNVFYYLALQFEALVILLQDTHCTNAEKLVLSGYQLAGSSVIRKHGLATFSTSNYGIRFWTNRHRHRRLSGCAWTLMVNVYKLPRMRLQSLDFPGFPHLCLYTGDFNCHHVEWGYDDNRADGECLVGWARIDGLALLYNAKDAARFYSGSWNTGNYPDLAFASAGPT